MRSLPLALVLALLAAAPAAADYRRLPLKQLGSLAMAGGELFVVDDGTLTAYRPDGGARTIALPKTAAKADYATASERGLAVSMFPRRSFYRPTGKGWQRVGDRYAQVRVDGARLSILHESRFDDNRHSVDIVDLRNGSRRRYAVRSESPSEVKVAGRYFAVSSDDSITVRSLATGARVYRLARRSSSNWTLLSGGRIVTAVPTDLEFVNRFAIAGPGHPRPRRIRDIGLGAYDFAVAPGGIAIVRGDPRARSQIAILGWNGRIRPVTPLLSSVDQLEYDGGTLAFAIGTCLFIGPMPAAGQLPPVAEEGCVRSPDGGAG